MTPSRAIRTGNRRSGEVGRAADVRRRRGRWTAIRSASAAVRVGPVGSRAGPGPWRGGRGTTQRSDGLGQGPSSRPTTRIVVGGLVGEREQGSVAVAVPGRSTPRPSVGDGFLLEVRREQAPQRRADAVDVIGRRVIDHGGREATEHGSVSRDEHVLRPDRAMHHPAGVKVGDGGGEIGDQESCPFGRHRPDGGQGARPHVLAHQDRSLVGLAELDEGEHARMVEALEARRFVPDALAATGGRGPLAGHGPSVDVVLDADVVGHRSRAVAVALVRMPTDAGVPGTAWANASGTRAVTVTVTERAPWTEPLAVTPRRVDRSALARWPATTASTRVDVQVVAVARADRGFVQADSDGIVGRGCGQVVGLALSEVQSGEIDRDRGEHHHDQQGGGKEEQRGAPVPGRVHDPSRQSARPASPSR